MELSVSLPIDFAYVSSTEIDVVMPAGTAGLGAGISVLHPVTGAGGHAGYTYDRPGQPTTTPPPPPTLSQWQAQLQAAKGAVIKAEADLDEVSSAAELADAAAAIARARQEVAALIEAAELAWQNAQFTK